MLPPHPLLLLITMAPLILKIPGGVVIWSQLRFWGGWLSPPPSPPPAARTSHLQLGFQALGGRLPPPPRPPKNNPVPPLAGPVTRPRGSLSGHLCVDLTDLPGGQRGSRGALGGVQWLRPGATDAECGTERSTVGAAAWTAGSGSTAAGMCVPCARVCQRGRGQAGSPEGEWALLPRPLGGLCPKLRPALDPSRGLLLGEGLLRFPGRPTPAPRAEWDPQAAPPLPCPAGAHADCTFLLCRFSAGPTKTVSFPPRLSPE